MHDAQAGGPAAPVDPYLGRRSLEELAGEVVVAFAHAARLEAEGRGIRPSIGGLRTLLDVANSPESPLAPDNAGGRGEEWLLASLPNGLKGWFRREFWGRVREERELMTSVASKLLVLPHLERDAEEALGLKRPISAGKKLAGILACVLAYPAALWGGVFVWGTLLSSGKIPAGPLSSVAILAFVVIASWPLLNLIRSWGLMDFRPGRAGRYAFPAMLAYCCAVGFVIDLGLVSPPGVWT